MVTIGSLEWTVSVEQAGDAKQQVEEVEEKVRDSKEAMEGADEATGDVNDKFGTLKGVQQAAGRGFDKLAAKSGFLGTALTFVAGIVASVKGALASLAGLITGPVLAALALAGAMFMTNFGGYRDYILDVLEGIRGAYEDAVEAIRPLWEDFVGALVDAVEWFAPRIEAGVGKTLDNLREFITGFVAGVEPIWTAVWESMQTAGKLLAPVIDPVISILQDLNDQFNIVKNIVAIALNPFGPAMAILMNFYDTGKRTEQGLNALQSTFSFIFNSIRGIVNTVLPELLQIFDSTFGEIFATVRLHMGPLLQEIEETLDVIVTVFNNMMSLLMPIVKPIFNAIAFVVGAQMKVTMFIIQRVLETIWGLWQGYLKQLWKYIKVVLDIVGTLIAQNIDIWLTAFRVFMNLLQGDWSEAWEAIKGLVDRTLNRVDHIIQTVKDSILETWDALEGGVISTAENIKSTVVDIFTGLGDAVTGSIQAAWNSVVPDTIEIPEWTIGGGSIGIEELNREVNIPEHTIGGQSLNLPQLQTGGLIEGSGLAVLHEGERVLPAEVAGRGPSDGGAGGTTINKTIINVGGIEIGDQSIDISQLSRAEMRQLAQEIGEVLGNQTSNVIG